MMDRRAARMAYIESIKQAALDQFEATENALRKLTDLKPAHITKLVADVNKRHLKILNRIDRQIEEESYGERD